MDLTPNENASTRATIERLLARIENDPEAQEPFEGAEFTFAVASDEKSRPVEKKMRCVKLLGSGGRGWVYECKELMSSLSEQSKDVISKKIAIKIAKDGCDERIRKEANTHQKLWEALSKSKDPTERNVIPKFIELGEFVFAQNNSPRRAAILMEAVGGLTLEDALKPTNARKSWSSKRWVINSLRVAGGILKALASLDKFHAKVSGGSAEHGDVKESNIIVADIDEDKIKRITILDFGAWRNSDAGSEEGTRGRSIEGQKADQYSVGMILENLLEPCEKIHGEKDKRLEKAKELASLLKNCHYGSTQKAAEEVFKLVDRFNPPKAALLRRYWAPVALVAVVGLILHDGLYVYRSYESANLIKEVVKKYVNTPSKGVPLTESSLNEFEGFEGKVRSARSNLKGGWLIGPLWSNGWMIDLVQGPPALELQLYEDGVSALQQLVKQTKKTSSNENLSEAIQLQVKWRPPIQSPKTLVDNFKSNIQERIDTEINRQISDAMNSAESLQGELQGAYTVEELNTVSAKIKELGDTPQLAEYPSLYDKRQELLKSVQDVNASLDQANRLLVAYGEKIKSARHDDLLLDIKSGQSQIAKLLGDKTFRQNSIPHVLVERKNQLSKMQETLVLLESVIGKAEALTPESSLQDIDGAYSDLLAHPNLKELLRKVKNIYECAHKSETLQQEMAKKLDDLMKDNVGVTVSWDQVNEYAKQVIVDLPHVDVLKKLQSKLRAAYQLHNDVQMLQVIFDKNEPNNEEIPSTARELSEITQELMRDSKPGSQINQMLENLKKAEGTWLDNQIERIVRDKESVWCFRSGELEYFHDVASELFPIKDKVQSVLAGRKNLCLISEKLVTAQKQISNCKNLDDAKAVNIIEFDIDNNVSKFLTLWEGLRSKKAELSESKMRVVNAFDCVQQYDSKNSGSTSDLEKLSNSLQIAAKDCATIFDLNDRCMSAIKIAGELDTRESKIESAEKVFREPPPADITSEQIDTNEFALEINTKEMMVEVQSRAKLLNERREILSQQRSLAYNIALCASRFKQDRLDRIDWELMRSMKHPKDPQYIEGLYDQLEDSMKKWLSEPSPEANCRPKNIILVSRRNGLEQLAKMNLFTVPLAIQEQQREFDALESASKKISDFNSAWIDLEQRPNFPVLGKKYREIKSELPTENSRSDWAKGWYVQIDQDSKNIFDKFVKQVNGLCDKPVVELKNKFASKGEDWGKWLHRLRLECEEAEAAIDKKLISRIKIAHDAAWAAQSELWWDEMGSAWGGWRRDGAVPTSMTRQRFIALTDSWIEHYDGSSKERLACVSSTKNIISGSLELWITEAKFSLGSDELFINEPKPQLSFSDKQIREWSWDLNNKNTPVKVARVVLATDGFLDFTPKWTHGLQNTNNYYLGLNTYLIDLNDAKKFTAQIIKNDQIEIYRDYHLEITLAESQFLKLTFQLRLPLDLNEPGTRQAGVEPGGCFAVAKANSSQDPQPPSRRKDAQ